MPTPPVTGQIVVSTSAQQLTATTIVPKGWVMKAPSTNAQPVFIGGATVTRTTGYAINPGDSFAIEVAFQAGLGSFDTTPNDVYVVGTASDVLTWLAFR